VTPHLEASAGDYAPTVLLPGDPDRAAWLARTFFEAPRQVNAIRGELGFTGLFRGMPISVQATGMGRPSFSVYAHELVEAYGARRLIRIGTCGGLHAAVAVRELFVADTAIMEDALKGGEKPLQPDTRLLGLARDKARTLGIACHSGPMLCSDVFYPQPPGRFDWARDKGIIAVDMETAGLFKLAVELSIEALSICTVVDNPVSGEQAALSERQGLFTDMARLALEVAVAA